MKEKLLSDGDAIGRWEKLNSSISSYSSEDALRSYYQNSIKPLEPRLVESEAALGLSTRAEDERPLSVSREKGKTESVPNSILRFVLSMVVPYGSGLVLIDISSNST